jgi:phage repressor protein C with HTH and peptisase S24 domain
VQFSDNQAKHAAVKQFVETTERELVCAQLNPAEQVKYPLKIVDSIHKIVGVIF